MTDVTASQLGYVAVCQSAPAIVKANAYEIGFVAVTQEAPSKAAGARAMQIAFVTVGIEYPIPKVYVPIGLGQLLMTMPYYFLQ